MTRDDAIDAAIVAYVEARPGCLLGEAVMKVAVEDRDEAREVTVTVSAEERDIARLIAAGRLRREDERKEDAGWEPLVLRRLYVEEA